MHSEHLTYDVSYKRGLGGALDSDSHGWWNSKHVDSDT